VRIERCEALLMVDEVRPIASRPHMPGYGIVAADEGSGLLPWSWAEERLIGSHDYWLATSWSDGRPHVMPVWAVWFDASLWFSCSLASRKTRNLLADRRGVLTTDDPRSPVIVEGVTEIVSDPVVLRAVLDAENAKYGTDYGIELLDTAVSACFRFRPVWAFGLSERDFTGSPTRWRFERYNSPLRRGPG
jgi:Pyridoxamine 5'-phosphate oxidase